MRGKASDAHQVGWQKFANVVRPQLGNFNSSLCEFPVQQTPHDMGPVLAGAGGQAAYIVQVYVVLLQFSCDVTRHRRWLPCA